MKWEQDKQYSRQELQSMQKDAIERVRQMQQRSEQVLRHSPRTPSFFVSEETPKQQKEEPPVSAPPLSSPIFPQPQHPSSSFHSASVEQNPHKQTNENPLEQILSSLNIDRDRIVLLSVFFLLASDKSDPTLLLALLYLFL